MNNNNYNLLNHIKNISLHDEERYLIEYSKDHKKVLRINREGKFVYLGSKYTVIKDINSFRESIKNINFNTIILVWGFGTGEHILELLKEISSSNKIIVIEPDERVLIENLLYNDLTNILNDDRVFLFFYNKENLKQFLSENIKDVDVNNVESVHFANYDKIYDKEYMEFNEGLIEYTKEITIQLTTSLRFSKEFFMCFMNNIKTIVNSITINKLKNKFEGMPAIVVSAGPSLSKNVKFLKEVQDKFIIITGGRTLTTLLDAGITPDFVCSVDPGEASYTVMEKSLNNSVPLVFSEVSNYKVVKEYQGAKVFFKDLDFLDITHDFMGIEVDALRQGGSVAHVCISIAEYLGCNKIIFIGQDLAYTDNKYHAESAKDSTGNNISEEEKYIYVEDVYGDKVPTTIILDFYRKNIEAMIEERKDVTFINSTEGGANIKGTLVKPLQQSISEYSDSEGIDKNIEVILNSKPEVDKQMVLSNITKILDSFEIANNICKEALIYTEKLYKYYDENVLIDINHSLKKLDCLDNKLNEQLEKIRIIKKLNAPLISKVMISDEFREKQGENEKQRGKRISLKSETLYKGLIEILKEAKIELEKVKADLIIQVEKEIGGTQNEG